ncbi:hypothetical protein LXA47_25415 [Massilia sp. P8910]|uniref:hypothetical protein n=1 Tax=Massilia antarctica TaxID=2765360 RepID=UPI001E4985F2|nr:hypothetical protein [Massilia antarctica]MCE3606918.1 hypothetical protein [Massilia antarctica]
MGLLDMFNDPQTAGLLGAAAQIMERSGDTRHPYSAAQAFGTGINSYMQINGAMRARQLQEEQEKQEAERRALQIQQLRGDMQIKQQMLEQGERIRKRLTPEQLPRQGQQDAADYGFAGAAPGVGPMSPKTGGPDWMQQFQAASGAGTPQAQPQPAMRPPGNEKQSAVAYLTHVAQVRTEEGDIEGANKAWEHVAKLSPEVNKIEAGMYNGKPVSIITFKDGQQKVSEFGLAPNMTEVDLGDHKRFVDKNAVSNGQEYMVNQSANSKASEQSAAASRAQSASQFGRRLAFDKQQAEGGAESAFTPEAISNAAARYNLDGTLPPMGMGKSGSAGRAAILNKAAELKSGVDPTQQRRDQLNLKGDVSARNAALRDYSSGGKSGQAIQATNTGLNHLETIEQLAMAQKNGNVKLWNQLANRLAAETGAPAPTNLQAAITMVAPEVSKAVIGASGGQEERATFAKNFNPNGSPEQAVQGIGVIKELMGGRLTEAQRTYERTVGKKDFRDTMLSPAAQRVLDKAHAHSEDSQTGAKPTAAPVMSAKPTPNVSNKGRILVEHETGKRFRSNGIQWVEI